MSVFHYSTAPKGVRKTRGRLAAHASNGWPHMSSKWPHFCMCLDSCCQDDQGCRCKECICRWGLRHDMDTTELKAKLAYLKRIALERLKKDDEEIQHGPSRKGRKRIQQEEKVLYGRQIRRL